MDPSPLHNRTRLIAALLIASGLSVGGLVLALLAPATAGVELGGYLLAAGLVTALWPLALRHRAALITSSNELADRDRLLKLLADSERRFNLVVQSLHIGVWDELHDATGAVTRWRSSRFHELLGYLPGELDSSHDLIALLGHPDEREAIAASFAEQLARSGEVSVELRLKTHHHGYRWFRVRGKADHDGSGRVTRLAGALTDIHERRENDRQMRASQGELQQMAFADALTGIPNRRAFNDHIRRCWAQCESRGQPLAVLLLDLDHFKAYNDRYGHAAGDACLARVARRLRSAVFLPDAMVARLGGEEFVVLLPDTPATAALGVAGRILELVRAPAIEHAAAPAGHVTMSIGVASTDTQAVDGPDALLRLADRALYEAKARGRDGVFHVRGLGTDSIAAA